MLTQIYGKMRSAMSDYTYLTMLNSIRVAFQTSQSYFLQCFYNFDSSLVFALLEHIPEEPNILGEFVPMFENT